jgi:hypothetical protein
MARKQAMPLAFIAHPSRQFNAQKATKFRRQVNFNGVLMPFAPLRVVVKGMLARDGDGRGVPNTDGKTNADRPVAEERPKTLGHRSGRRRGDDKHRRNSLARDDDLLAIVVGTHPLHFSDAPNPHPIADDLADPQKRCRRRKVADDAPEGGESVRRQRLAP